MSIEKSEPEREPPVRCSIVLSTCNRATQLQRTLQHVAKLSCPDDWELVVVDNGSADETQGVISEFATRSPIPCKIIREPQGGLARAQNAGCGAASGEILVMLHDDCYPADDYLVEMLGIFEGDASVGFVAGRVLLFDDDDARITVLDRDERRTFCPHSFPSAGEILGANLAFRRELYQDVEGFNDVLGAGTPLPAEDIEFCARALENGWKGVYEPAPTVYHHHGRGEGERTEILKRYDRGRGAYFASVLLSMPSLRTQCARQWNRNIRYGRLQQAVREIAGALTYLVRGLLATVGCSNIGRRAQSEMST